LIRTYEELSMNAHPALQTQMYDGWVLRFANGYTNRANSVNPLYPSTIEVSSKIDECEKRYGAQGLPAIFKLNEGSDPYIDRLLETRGYDLTKRTTVMSLDLRSGEYATDDCLMADHADDQWIESFLRFSRLTDPTTQTTARSIFANVRSPMVCGRVVVDGITVACGEAVIERGHAGLQNIVVDESYRGKGYGRRICESLLAYAKGMGAHIAYLQVMPVNAAAANLYARLGFGAEYAQWYRVKSRD